MQLSVVQNEVVSRHRGAEANTTGPGVQEAGHAAGSGAPAPAPERVQVIRVDEDRIDSLVAIQFKDAVRALVDPEAGRVILDLGRVSFIDSSGLGAVIAAMKGLGPGQRLELAALSPVVDKVFRLTRMDSVLAIHEAVPPLGEAGPA